MKGVTKGPGRGRPNLLYQAHFAIDMFDLPKALEKRGFTLNRAHRKDNDGLGSTVQLMLVYQKGAETIQRNKRWEAEHAFFGNTGKRVGFLWPHEVYKNLAAGMVPPHIQFKCGNPKPVFKDAPSLDISGDNGFIINGEEVTPPNIFGDLQMVRIALNVYPDMRHLIPDWVEVRARHREKVVAENREVLQDL